jgi:hypothetical protein
LGRFSVRPGENDDHDGGLLVAFTDMVLRSAENGSVALLDGKTIVVKQLRGEGAHGENNSLRLGWDLLDIVPV